MKTGWMTMLPHRSWPWLVASVFASVTFLTINLAAKPMTAQSGNACLQTAASALTSCNGAAQSSYQNALGKCINLTDPMARRTCEKGAAADLKDALDTCEGGFEVRQAACEKFGP